jgi:hypothetical protein
MGGCNCRSKNITAIFMDKRTMGINSQCTNYPRDIYIIMAIWGVKVPIHMSSLMSVLHERWIARCLVLSGWLVYN